jgi:hypothetical protein
MVVVAEKLFTFWHFFSSFYIKCLCASVCVCALMSNPLKHSIPFKKEITHIQFEKNHIATLSFLAALTLSLGAKNKADSPSFFDLPRTIKSHRLLIYSRRN